MSKAVFDCCLQDEIPFELLDIANHPTPSDLEKRLGKDLVEVFLKTCKPIEKILFGRDKPLKGPEGNLWINPEDRLGDKKVKITQAPNSPSTSYTDCLQALTHHGILEIGKKYEEKMAEMNRRAMEDAVKDAEELSKFEADSRIKFHVETETKKLNEEWQRRLQELMEIHVEEKNDMVKIFQEARTIFCEFIAKKCKESEKLVEKARADTRDEMKAECTKIIDDELANQHKTFEESMETTLNNLRANDRDRMNELRNQCLNAMDVQHHLMMCRQITELLHLMSVEKRHYEAKLSELKDKYDRTISLLQSQHPQSHLSGEHQSKSIFTAALTKTLDSVNVNTLDEHEKRIFDEIHRIMANNDRDSKIFIVTEASSSAVENSRNIIDENDWINRKEDEMRLQRTSASVAVQWEKQDPTCNVFNDDTFMSSIFNRMSTDVERPSLGATQKIASSIIAMVRESNDDKLLEESINELLHNMVTKHQRIPVESVMQPVIPMPVLRNEPLRIKDSMELINGKRISIQTDQCEGHSYLLGAIDSREIISRRTSSTQPVFYARNSPASFQSFASIKSQESSDDNKDSNRVPPYMKIPPYRCRNFLKMTEEEWMQLQVTESRETRRRSSSIQLEGAPTRTSSRRSSILKWPSMNAQAGSIVLNDALQPIREKCLEAAGGIKVESILRKLCEDNDCEHQMSSTSCSAQGQN